MVQMAKIGNVVLGIGVIGLAALVIAERGPSQQRVAEAQARPSAEAVERMPELVLTGRGAASGSASPALATALETAAAKDAQGAPAGGSSASSGAASAGAGAPATGGAPTPAGAATTGGIEPPAKGAQGSTAPLASNGAIATVEPDADAGATSRPPAGLDGATQGSSSATVAATGAPAVEGSTAPTASSRRSVVLTGPAGAERAALERAADALGPALGDVGEPEPATEEEMRCDAPEDGADLYRAAAATRPGATGAVPATAAAPLGVLTKEQAQALLAKIPAARVTKHVVKAGDTLIGLAKASKCSVGLIRRVNRLKDETIRLGATLSIPQGPFHASVDRAGYRITITLDGAAVQSYAVGLGRDGSTPAGEFEVRSRVEKPDWTSPEGDYFAAGDPANPLGSRWLGFGEGGYGIHGTTDPTSIGRQASRGCVRLNAGDVEEVYDFLTVGSRVVIK